MEVSKMRKGLVFFAVLTICLVGAGIIAGQTSFPILAMLEIVLLALLLKASVLERHFRIRGLTGIVVSALGVLQAIYEWAEMWKGPRRYYAVIAFFFLSLVAIGISIVDIARQGGWRQVARSSAAKNSPEP